MTGLTQPTPVLILLNDGLSIPILRTIMKDHIAINLNPVDVVTVLKALDTYQEYMLEKLWNNNTPSDQDMLESFHVVEVLIDILKESQNKQTT